MTTRKQKTPVRKPARGARRPPQRRRPVVAREKPAPARSAAPTLSLAADCTVAEADSLKKSLLRLLPEPRPVKLEVQALQRIDTAALQLLAAFVRDRRIAGRRVEWRSRAPALDTAAALLGLRDMLELPAEGGR